MRARRMCARVWYTSGEQRENQMSTSETELSGWGEGEPGQLPARAASRQCSFLKTLGQAGLGEWLFKTLGSFYFTTREVNSDSQVPEQMKSFGFRGQKSAF